VEFLCFDQGRLVGALVKDQKGHQTRKPGANGFRLNPKTFVFIDRSSGTKRFEVNAAPDGSMPVEESSSLLAMQCVVRGLTPEDFHVMVSVGDDLLSGLLPRTSRLIEACMSTSLPMHISQRQQQVLRGVLQNLSNKEIAAKLNLAERTVKFHVSALLQKFNVPGRVSLMQKAGDILSPEKKPAGNGPAEVPPLIPHRSPLTGGVLPPQLVRMTASERRATR
jgi:DNA-binding CsgD family transcriptional regulator